MLLVCYNVAVLGCACACGFVLDVVVSFMDVTCKFTLFIFTHICAARVHVIAGARVACFNRAGAGYTEF